jgi:hypothetical protein
MLITQFTKIHPSDSFRGSHIHSWRHCSICVLTCWMISVNLWLSRSLSKTIQNCHIYCKQWNLCEFICFWMSQSRCIGFPIKFLAYNGPCISDNHLYRTKIAGPSLMHFHLNSLAYIGLGWRCADRKTQINCTQPNQLQLSFLTVLFPMSE